MSLALFGFVHFWCFCRGYKISMSEWLWYCTWPRRHVLHHTFYVVLHFCWPIFFWVAFLKIWHHLAHVDWQKNIFVYLQMCIYWARSNYSSWTLEYQVIGLPPHLQLYHGFWKIGVPLAFGSTFPGLYDWLHVRIQNFINRAMFEALSCFCKPLRLHPLTGLSIFYELCARQ